MIAFRATFQGILFLVALLFATNSHALEFKGRQATVVVAEESLLQRFDERIDTSRLRPGNAGGTHLTMADAVTGKVDILVEKVMSILEMDPKLYGLTVVILPDTESVRQAYRKAQSNDPGYIAFYAPLEDTIYLSVADVTLQVIAHEIAHAIIYHYFRVGPSEKIHELLAQYAASQMPAE